MTVTKPAAAPAVRRGGRRRDRYAGWRSPSRRTFLRITGGAGAAVVLSAGAGDRWRGSRHPDPRLVW